ncbi:MAG: hypothetical protein AB7F96_07125 [Beijerinckiaceae bacterium]
MYKAKHTLMAMGAVAAMGLASVPARALDDDGHQSIFQTFTGLLGTQIGIPGVGGSDKQDAPIHYRERAPLVLPPSNSLRSPMPSVRQRNAAWPKDPDVERARRAAAPRGIVPRDDAGNEILTPQYLRNTGRLSRNTSRDPYAEQCDMSRDPLATPCNVKDMWSVLKNNKLKDGPKDLVAGQEPPRRNLTDPPTGYRTPSRKVKYTFEPVKDTAVVPDPREAIREEARRDREYR